MGRIKYYFRRLKALDYKNMWRIAGLISKETGKFRLFILFDMIGCSFIYQSGYLDYFEFEFYLLKRAERKTFITGGIANSIIVKYNQKEFRHKFADKSEFNKVFREYIGRDFVDLRESSDELVKAFLTGHDVVMAKVTDSLMGYGVERFVTAEIEDFDLFKQERMERRQFLIEEYFVQHEAMSSLYPESVNTLRMITFFDGKDVHVLEGVLKIGNGGHLDNFGAGGMYTVLDDSGKVLYPAFDKDAVAFKKHPITGTDIVGFQVPLYNDIVEMLDRAAREVPQIQYVGWDVAVGQKRPSLIEGNYNTGVFQMKPSLTGSKEGLLPKFRKVIDI
ncbi:sugar-transfer associated ATP-grasp domain-containing protein [Erysipelothrix rhusiopathiae]|uniref:sugar-transfer associated ATP-grasp domain-containing protein n=1 Tax=Erysipelothrix rhusiopathiae TaxID=1648 RepID=UPI002B248D1E|nr:sugar-transfer associated ATP-grasp domain-containing protein [Erysipelothrix rhusiopathiae]WRB93784.1 sugar-transfer associated ATP-grasp domain-containing protein [Erysipelothrix rhusiopathiae]